MFSDSDRNIIASLVHEACEFHCEDCDRCLTEADLDPTHGTCDNCTPLSDCFAERTGIEWIDYTWKNCVCPDCLQEQNLERTRGPE